MIFSDNISENIKNSLNALELNGRMPHAVILNGGTADQRKAIEKHLAAWAVCSSKLSKPCMVCKNCVNAQNEAHSDIYYAKPSGKTKIYNKDELKNIIHDASIKPNQADKKVYIFEDCDKRFPDISQNILLKTLEEPPQDILFILSCENSKSLLQTIRSRSSELTLSDEQQPSGQASEIAEAIILGILSSSEINLLKATYRLSDRFTAQEALEAAVLALGEGLSLKSGYESGNKSETAEKLCRKLTKAQFLDLIEITRSAQDKINKNVPLTLLSTWLCASYRKIVW